MVDRESLKDRAVEAGKSVAGTLGKGARALKERATTVATDDESGVSISEVDGQYLVIDSDGSAIGPYDDKMKAGAKARELKREKQGMSEASESRSETMDEANGGSQASNGKVQRAATRFAEGVNRTVGAAVEKADEAMEEPDDEQSGPRLPSMERQDDSREPSLAFMEQSEGKTNGPQLPFMQESEGEPSLPFMGKQEGEPQLPSFGMEGDPQMPAFGPQDSTDDVFFGSGDESEPDNPLRWF